MARICEFFTSIQGEGKRVGIPSLFIRSYGCNLCCKGFGQPDPADESTWHEVKYCLGESPKYGCDSPISWHPMFKNLAKDYKPEDLFDELCSKYSKAKLKEIVITGGEPLLHQKFWLDFFKMLYMYVPQVYITFETNGIIAPTPEMEEFIKNSAPNWKFLFSVSPKLNCVAGVKESVSINYDTLNKYVSMAKIEKSIDLQLKFVFNGEERAFNKVKEIYNNLTTKPEPEDILLMPVGAWQTEQDLKIATADACMKEGFRYCTRTHVDIWGKKTGV